MNAIIIYGTSKEIPGRRYQKVRYAEGVVYMRTEFCKGFDVARALDRANPRAGEIVVNTMEVPD